MARVERGCPRMTKKYVQNMLPFVKYMVGDPSLKPDPPKIEKQQNATIKFDDYLTKERNDIIMEQELKQRKKYDGYMDRIYGKQTRQRSNLEGLMRQQCNSSPGKKRFLNNQERQVQQAIKHAKDQMEKDNKLMHLLNRDYKQSLNPKSIRNLSWQQIQQTQLIQEAVHNQIKQTLMIDKDNSVSSKTISKSYFRKNQFPASTQSSHHDMLQFHDETRKDSNFTEHSEGFFRVLQTFQTQPSFAKLPDKASTFKQQLQIQQAEAHSNQYEKYMRSVRKAQTILSERNEIESRFQTHIDHEREFLGIPYRQMENEMPEEKRPASAVFEKIRKVKSTISIATRFRTLKRQATMRLLTKDNSSPTREKAIKTEIGKDHVKETGFQQQPLEGELETAKEQIRQINNKCATPDKACGNMLKKYSKAFRSKYIEIQQSFHEAFP